LILRDWGRLEEALALHKKKEAICLELGNKNSLQISYGNQAGILQAWGRLEDAMALHKKQEAICLELGNKNSLQASYGNQALILKDWGRLEEALALHKKQEAICLELGKKVDLGYCYWQWGLPARQQGDKQAERQKLEQALAIFSELKMPRERDAVQAELDKTNAA
jgi:tetratricopeptide (TPR) repeat protein